MELALFAQNVNADAFAAGQIVGIILAVLLCVSIPIGVGLSMKQPVLGIVGGVCALPASVLLGCLGGLPVALFFVIIIAVVSSNSKQQTRRRPRRYDDEEDDYDDDRPRRSRRDDEDDDDYNDRPRRRRPSEE